MENSDNDKHVSVHFVRCLKCGKILKCSRFDTAALLRHIETDHPELVVSSKSTPDNNMPSNAQESTSREPLPSTDENNQQNQPQTVLNRRKGNMGEGSYPPSSEQSPSPNEKDPDPKQTHYIIKSEKCKILKFQMYIILHIVIQIPNFYYILYNFISIYIFIINAIL